MGIRVDNVANLSSSRVLWNCTELRSCLILHTFHCSICPCLMLGKKYKKRTLPKWYPPWNRHSQRDTSSSNPSVSGAILVSRRVIQFCLKIFWKMIQDLNSSCLSTSNALPKRFHCEDRSNSNVLLPNSCNAVYIDHGNNDNFDWFTNWTCFFGLLCFLSTCFVWISAAKWSTIWSIQNSKVSGHGTCIQIEKQMYRVVNNCPLKPFSEIFLRSYHPCSKFNYIYIYIYCTCSWMCLFEIILNLGGDLPKKPFL